MKTCRLIPLALLMMHAMSIAQETSIQLPTNDNSSSLNVTRQNGTTVFKVDGTGQMTGDGSGFSNVKPVVAYAQGNQSVIFHEGAIPGLNIYEAQIMREVTIACPGPGVIFAQASGYCDWESLNEDLVRIWFHPHPTVSPTSSWETPDFHNLRILSDYQCADSSDQYTSWSITKTYTVSSAQDYTVKICADKPWTESKVLIGDVCLQLMFFPTGGTGPATFRNASFEPAETAVPEMLLGNSIDGRHPMDAGIQEVKRDGDKLEQLETEIEALKQQVSRLLELNGMSR